MSIKDLKKDELVYLLRRQYPTSDTTFGPCPACEKPARGAGFCKSCLIAELVVRGVSGMLINRYCQGLNERITLTQRLEALRAEIVGDAQ